MRNPRMSAAVLAAVAVCFLTVPASAAGGAEIASMNAGATALVWQPAVAYERMVLTVSGPGGVFTREFDSATAPSLSLYDEAGYPLADGGYNWELTATPVLGPGLRAQLARARKTGDESQIEALRQSGLLPKEPMVLSGHVRVQDGAFVRGDLDEAEAPAAGPRSQSGPVRSTHAPDFVINDDLIVNGGSSSICVGFDCVNNEPFGFDTIRLKENNLRILFMDTSVGTFPTNDWMLVANDSASGGQNRFSIEDIDAGRTPFTVEAGAAANSVYVDSTSRVGFRTSTPVLDLHVATGNTPGIRLEQNGSSGFTPQTWDIAGNEANFFVRDVTGGSTLPFRIEPGTASSTLYLDSNERVGIGTSAPSETLHMRGTGGTTKAFVEEASGSAAQRTLLQLTNNGGTEFRMTDTSTSVTWLFQNTGGNFRFTDAGDAFNEFILTGDGDLTITGEIFTAGSCMGGCDEVFAPEFELRTIEQHSELMWRNRHLPAVGPTAENGRWNLSRKTGGILHELEVAHIYIQQLNDGLKAKTDELTELEQQNAELAARLARLEALVGDLTR